MLTSTRESIMPDRATVQLQSAQVGLLLEGWQRLRRHRAAMTGLFMLMALCILAAAAPLFTAQDPERQQLMQVLQPSSWTHPLGTDHLGRDLWARVLYGGRLSLVIGFLAVGVGLAVGVPLGAMSGFHGGGYHFLLPSI